MTHLKKEYFDSVVLSKLFDAYSKCFNKFGKAPSKNMVVNYLTELSSHNKAAEAILDQIFNRPEIEVVEKEYILSEVVSFGKRARMSEAIRKSIDLLDNNDFDAITAEVRDALLFNIDVKMGYDLYDIDERYKNLKLAQENKISTGYAQIDKVMNGGWTKRELIAIMGPPGLGKSIFLPNFGIKALLKGLNVVHYSMEMSEDRLGMRYDAIASSINIHKLIDHPDEIKKRYETYKKATAAHLKLKEFPTGMASVNDIEAHLEQLQLYEDFYADMIIVDYGDIMRSTRKTANTYEEQGWVFRELRGLAVKRDLVVITATQTNRDSLDSDGGTKEVVGMEKTADSMEKNRILDVLFSITQKRQEKDQGKINLWVAKNRNGESNTLLEFLINYENMQIKEALLSNSSVGNTDE